MTLEHLQQRLAEFCRESIPTPGSGHTPERHRRLLQVGREDLTLAKLVEAHWDALAILAEADRTPHPGAIYGVWASEIPGKSIRLDSDTSTLTGAKLFCSGAGLIDRALITVGSLLVDVDLRSHPSTLHIDTSAWATEAFRLTNTGAVTFSATPVAPGAILCGPDWYTDRPGFWHGACGPAACWAGGVSGLLDAARRSHKDDPHTLAHLGAMHANLWSMTALLDTAGREIDLAPCDVQAGKIRALQLRHLIEQAATDTLTRFARAFGPAPLALDADTSRRFQEANLYLRQSHAERDLELLARTFIPNKVQV